MPHLALEDLAGRLLDGRRPEIQRAVDLFEFQNAIFIDKSKARRRARQFAAIKMMEHLEQLHDVKAGDLKSALKIDGYEDLLAEALVGGWLSIRRLPSDAVFANALLRRIDEARIASDVVDFLCSWRVTYPKKRASIAKALFVVREEGKTRAKQKWRDYSKWSILIHLLLARKYEFLPPKLNTKKFSEKLLMQVRDLENFRLLLAAHRSVLKLLPILDEEQVCKDVWLTDVSLPQEPVPYDRLPTATITKLEKYKSGVD